MSNEPENVSIIENPHAPDVFADFAASFSLIEGVVRITFTSVRPIETGGKVAPVVIGRLNMPTTGAQGLAVGLFNYLKDQGVDFSVPDASGQTQ